MQTAVIARSLNSLPPGRLAQAKRAEVAGGERESGFILDFVRRRIRQIREAKGLSARQVASRAGLPPSSYCSIETGAYGLTLPNLLKVLRALDADVLDVWPPEWEVSPDVSGFQAGSERLHLFRLRELLQLASASAACLFFVTRGGRVEVLARLKADEVEVRRLIRQTGQGSPPGDWVVMMSENRSGRMFVALRDAQVGEVVEKLTEHYLQLWLASRCV